MGKALTNSDFITKLDALITKLGSTPAATQIASDKLDDMLSNDIFIAKLDEVITAMGGTPTNIQVSADESDDMVLDSIFNGKMDEIIANASGGGGGGSGDLSTCTMTITGWNEGAYPEIKFPAIEDDSFFVGTMAVYNAPNGNYLLPLYKGKAMVFVLDANYTISGNAIDTGAGEIEVTGDFTITYNGI